MSKKLKMDDANAPIARHELLAMWLAAVKGDSNEMVRLYRLLKLHPQLSQWTKEFAERRRHDSRVKAKSFKKPKARPLSQWERSKNTLSKSGAVVVSGGLPSLGKRK